MNAEQQVLQAARTLVEAFASNDTEGYFAAFSTDATFVFHTTTLPLIGRAAYRALWDDWQRDGFRVLACASSNPVVSLQGELAIFIHDVATRLQVGGEVVESLERETIVFRQQQEQGRWLACHEHLSAMPEQLPTT
ncbi:nuclear transport factor 2 family protein [Pseudomonas sp. ML96]|uniref:YybH family protein n=1 Tax=Pseudomonas sp. ML96 TaxID=1523503 RepID=UPI0005BDACC2|nr:nuclear transport factor 2 family protein [Pseudomonas sp. ML96]